MTLSCFGTYDIRGKIDDEINEKLAYRIGSAVAKKFNALQVVVGYDARASSPRLSNSVVKGLNSTGVRVLNLGLAGTEEVYFAVINQNADAGIMVTASHNPIDYNGIKIVKSGSKPLKKEFEDIRYLVQRKNPIEAHDIGIVSDIKKVTRCAYIDKLISFVTVDKLKPLKIVINPGNGTAGLVIDELEKLLKKNGVNANFIKMHHFPDPTFPNGIPNPMLEENRLVTSEVIKREKADFGVAFDGDFDRCFIFDEIGNFIPTEHIISLLAEVFLNKKPGATIVHDTKAIWRTVDTISKFGGNAKISKTGHVFFKRTMRQANAIYGGELSGHHYFRDFYFCDSGMLPWLIIWEIVSKQKISLSKLISGRDDLFPSSGEINFNLSNPSISFEKVKEAYKSTATKIDMFDGLSMTFKNWRFNLRVSNTEPLVRLNVETRGNKDLLTRKVKELTKILRNK